MEIYFLSILEITMIHDNQISEHGGLHGLRDEALLLSALHYPQSMFNNHYLHPDIYHMAAAYMYSIIKNHPFLDGNKRTAFLTAVVFLKLNNIMIDATDDELFALTMAVAQSYVTEQDIAIFFKHKTTFSE